MEATTAPTPAADGPPASDPLAIDLSVASSNVGSLHVLQGFPETEGQAAGEPDADAEAAAAAHAAAAEREAAEREAQGFDAQGRVGGPYSRTSPPPGLCFSGYLKGVTGVVWAPAPAPAPAPAAPSAAAPGAAAPGAPAPPPASADQPPEVLELQAILAAQADPQAPWNREPPAAGGTAEHVAAYHALRREQGAAAEEAGPPAAGSAPQE